MADDGLVLVLSRLDEPVPVRPAFADELRRTLYAELGFASPAAALPAVAPVAAPVPVARERRLLLERLRGVLWPMTPRVALLIVVTLLLIACTVAGAWVITRSWLSSGPGGIQYTNDFAMTEVYRLPGADLNALQAGPDGATLYAIREAEQTGPPTEAAVVRLTPTADGTLGATDVLALESLRDPALWPEGTDLSRGTVVSVASNWGGRALSVATNGDMFLTLGLSTDPQRSPADTTVVVVHPDGTASRVVSLKELSEEGALGHPVPQGLLGVAAAAPDLLWAQVEDWSGSGSQSLYEIVDPNADGDWGDRLVRPVVLPSEVPAVTPDWAWQYGGFVAELSTPGHDRTSSALLPMKSRDGEYRLYRISDPDRDGDATDPGETGLVFKGPLGGPDGWPPAAVAPRVVDDAEPPIDETLVAGLTRMTRVSRITDAGVVDIVRAVPSVFGIAATRDGSIYLATWEPGKGENRMPGSIPVYRLVPLAVGATPPPGAIPDPSPEASSTPSSAPGSSPAAVAPTLLERKPLTEGVPRVAAWYGGTAPNGDWASELVFLGVDGSGPADMLPGRRAEGTCPSVDGRRVAYWSDDEVPNESYFYVEDVGGGNRARVTETANMVACPFPVEAIATVRTSADPWRVDWHAFGGEERELVPDMATDGFLDVTRDGRLLAVASGKDGRDVTVVDVTRGEANVLAKGMAARVRAAAWSPDGSQLAVAIGPWDRMNPQASGRFAIWILDTAGAAPRQLSEVEGRAPGLTWSTDGRLLAVLARDGRENGWGFLGKLFVVDVATGERRLVVPDAQSAQWSPVDPGTFAYATETTLFIETAGAPTREIPGPTGKLCDVCSERPTPRWPGFDLGWSPDGRYLATGAAIVGVVDVETGEYRVLLTDGTESLVYGARWWP